jgi:hypothetical protein
MVLQVAAIIVVGATTVARFHIFAVVDEMPHLAYVQEVAEHGRLPWLGRSYVSWQEVAIEKHTYPHRSPVSPRSMGFGGSSYEAWQPPLYYVLAAPAFLIPNDYRHKVFAVRAFDLLLLLAAVAIVARLSKAAFKERWLVPYCLALSTILWPGVIVRAVTVSNVALELPLVPLYVLVLWNATVKPRLRSLATAGGLLGLCVLTQLTLVCLAILLVIPLVALLRERRDKQALGTVALTLALPVVMVAPWLASNLSRYGALTANALLERMQESFEPGTRQYGLGTVLSDLPRFLHAALPQEWWHEYSGVMGVLLVCLPALILMSALPVLRQPRLLRSPAAALLGGPLLLGFATLVGIVLIEGWQSSFLPRFLNPMIPIFALFAAWSWLRVGSGQRSLLGLATVMSVAVGLIWVYMAGAYYFTHVGAMFGIHAGSLT